MLPNLPKQSFGREALFGILFRKWLRANPLMSGGYELKHTTANSIPFGVVADEQLVYLLSIKSNKGTLIRVQGVGGEPDYVYLRSAAAWLVIKYPRSFHIIDVEVFMQEKVKSKRRSLTSARAREISTYSIDL